MNGKNHKKTAFLLLLVIIFILGFLKTEIIQIIEFIVIYFISIKISPDIDLKWPFKKFLKHRSLTHHPLFILGVFAILYYRIDWPATAFLITWSLHVVTDHGSTKIKRGVNKIKKKVPFL